jgi:predicted TIM-barrel fold metal-dependent hydrolase
VPVSQVLYGTDYPFRTFDWTTEMLAAGAVFDADEMRGVLSGNAAALLRPASRRA